MKYFNVELLNAELSRLSERGLIPNKLKVHLLKFLEEYTLDEKTLREAFTAQQLPLNNDYGFGEQSYHLPQ